MVRSPWPPQNFHSMVLAPFAEVPHNKSDCFHILDAIPFSQLTEVFFKPLTIVLQNLLTQLPAHSGNNPLLSINTTTLVKAAIISQWTAEPGSPSHSHSLQSIPWRSARMISAKEIFTMSQPVNNPSVLSSILEIKIQNPQCGL